MVPRETRRGLCRVNEKCRRDHTKRKVSSQQEAPRATGYDHYIDPNQLLINDNAHAKMH